MTFGSLFSGIGGMDLGLERAGMTCRWQVENHPLCRKILSKHWPHVPKHGDISGINGRELQRVDVVAGGFPCQDLSYIGGLAGINGDSSGLWREFARLLGFLRPRWIFIENVPGLLANEPMRRVLGDISALGLDAEWESIPASFFGAPHVRDRVWIVAYPEGKSGLHKPQSLRKAPRLLDDKSSWWGANPWNEASPRVCRVDDGIPGRVARTERYGNAVVPQVAEWIGRRIMEANIA